MLLNDLILEMIPKPVQNASNRPVQQYLTSCRITNDSNPLIPTLAAVRNIATTCKKMTIWAHVSPPRILPSSASERIGYSGESNSRKSHQRSPPASSVRTKHAIRTRLPGT
ncbi:hypothetical protein OGAPHI_003171 [Ogataea philodendri]|uniref:Uncharacterized protein n=1 Tax=Ogataea philodendri TaxID=1378263 RepID=A0A9P8P912_9ASCO|nr:uncharacterized protein OGAPHI_003171 [Ogataea philodendri]KAH3667522.1 hypothetical protein OGAPHI_003171 [Ogataea philodendri]